MPTRSKRMEVRSPHRYDHRQVEEATELHYPNYAGVLAIAGCPVFTGTIDGKSTAFDHQELKPLWSFNVGTAITASPISFSVGGKKYIAVHVGGGNPWNVGLLKAAPELENLEGGSSLFVFALD